MYIPHIYIKTFEPTMMAYNHLLIVTRGIDPTTTVILMEDTAAVMGIAIAGGSIRKITSILDYTAVGVPVAWLYSSL